VDGKKMRRSSPRSERLVRALTSGGLRYGREDSFKLHPHGLLEDRVLLGTRASGLGREALLNIGAELGMPACYRPLLLDYFPHADMVLLGLEDRDDGGVFKIYLEFWERLKARVLATGSMEPALHDLGVKWDTTSGAHCRADYVCFPLLSVTDILSRVARLYPVRPGPPSYELSIDLIRQAARSDPSASFVYLEVGEGGSPRKSFDVNLYKANMTVSDAGPLLTRLARHYGIDKARVGQLLERVGGRCLGHLSAGLDRHGRDYATIYYEIFALDDPAG
jgi:hypothetical protein